MASTENLMAASLAALAARLLGFNAVNSGLTATGSSISDALALGPATFNVFSTVASSTGAQLPAEPGMVLVVNGGANALAVYPSSSTGNINGGSDGASFSVTAAKSALFIGAPGGYWAAILSA